MANKITVQAGVRDNASGPIDKIRDRFDKLQKEGAKGFAIGVGAGATTAALDAVGAVVGKIVGSFGEMSEAAKVEEVSLARLTTSVRENAAGWDGNLARIEDVLAARMKLGFADDEQRESLASLVAVTKDAGKALDIQRTAMDLARLKGMDLATASALLGKVAGGNVSILRRYGIVLDESATSTEALAAIQKIATGQAEAWAETNTGKLEVSEIRVAEAGEKLGDALNQIGAVVMPFVADAATAVADALFGIGTEAERSQDKVTESWRDAGTVAPFEALTFQAGATTAALHESREALLYMAAASKDDLVPSLAQASEATGNLTDAHDALQAALDATRSAVDRVDAAFDLFTGALFDADIAAGELAGRQQELAELLSDEPTRKGSDAWVIWNGKVGEAKTGISELQYQMAQAEGPTALQEFLLATQTALGDTDAAAAAAIATLLRLNATMAATENMASASKDDVFIPTVPTARTTVPLRGFASGGTVSGPVGMPQLAIVHGGETVTPAGRTGGIVLNATFNVSGTQSPEQFSREALLALRRELTRQDMSLS